MRDPKNGFKPGRAVGQGGSRKRLKDVPTLKYRKTLGKTTTEAVLQFSKVDSSAPHTA